MGTKWERFVAHLKSKEFKGGKRSRECEESSKLYKTVDSAKQEQFELLMYGRTDVSTE